MQSVFRTSMILIASVAVTLSLDLAQGSSEAGLVAQTPHFALHSDLVTNVHDALLEAGRMREKGKLELFESGAEAECFDGLAPSMRTAWNLAVDYYASVISSRKWSDRQQFLIRLDLAGVKELTREQDMRYCGIARSFMAAATPAYQACRWESQDHRNRDWIQSLITQLDAHEDAISRRLAKLYDKPLGGLPIRVDVVETVNWSGATTWMLLPDGGHIVISNVEYGPLSLEYIFHEASHTLMGRNHPVRVALKQAAERTGITLPEDLWHAVLFYMTGETVSHELVEAGEPEYTPMLFEGNIFSQHHAAMKQAWSAYLDGDRDLDQAAENLLRAHAVESR